VNLYSNFSFDNVPQRYDLMNAYEYTSYNNSVGTYSFTDAEIASYKNNSGTDWQDEIFQTGFTQNHKAVISGGTESARYYVSPSYYKMTGTIINTEASSYGLNTEIDVDISQSY
jgi:type IV secretory pathway component VirB8